MRLPKGRIFIIGGAEHKSDGRALNMEEYNKDFEPFEILKGLLPGKKAGRSIEIIPTASRVPEEIWEMYKKAFSKLGFSNVNFLDVRTREDASNEKFVSKIKKAYTVFFTGGSQFRLSTMLGGTKLIKAIEERYFDDEDFIIAGSSAGAMAMSKIMIYEGQTKEAMLKGDIKVMSGLGFLDYCIIDAHFVKRGRFGRLTQSIITNPSCVGIGLGEDTALLITHGNQAECIGSGMVIIIDASDIKYTNIVEASDYTPLCAEGLIVHILSRGNGYQIREREFIPKIKTPVKIISQNGQNKSRVLQHHQTAKNHEL
ncbi:MAG: cyanophycinase [Syntrophomonadaceae bacterium]